MFSPRRNVCLVPLAGRDRFVSLRVIRLPETVIDDWITFRRTPRLTNGGLTIYAEEAARG